MVGYCPICDKYQSFSKDDDEARCEHCQNVQGLSGMVEGVLAKLEDIGTAIIEPRIIRIVQNVKPSPLVVDSEDWPHELAEILKREAKTVSECAVRLNVPAIPVLLVVDSASGGVTVSSALWVKRDGTITPYTYVAIEEPSPPPPPPSSYQDYLYSPQWQEKRKVALDRAGHRCQVCNSPANLEVHHRTYKNLGNEFPEDLTVLCRLCHQTFHDSGRLSHY